MRGLSIAALALAALCAASACRRTAPAPSVAAIRLVPGRTGPELAEAGVAPLEVEGLTRTALEAAGFRMGAGRPRAFGARVEVVALRVATDASGLTWSEAAVALELEPEPDPKHGGADRPSLGETGQGSAPMGSSPSAAWRAALEEATREAASRLSLAVAAEEKAVAELLKDLDAADPRVREQAIVVLGERRSAAAVPALLTRLSDADPRLVDLAVGALAQIRDRRAVGPLIDLSRRRGPREQARFARLVGDIGGAEARGYLQTLAAGASEPVVRRAAAEALAELSAAEAAPQAAGR
jgi:hypothetical protein